MKQKNKKKRQRQMEKGVSDQPQPFREARRKGLHFMVLGTANTLDIIGEGNFYFLSKTDKADYNSLTAEELKHAKKAREEVRNAAKRLHAIARRLK